MRLMLLNIRQVDTPAGVRRIPVSACSLTGTVDGQDFESSLERDCMLLYAWDDKMDWFQSQPVRIDFVDENGKDRSYTPDLLAHFRPSKDKTVVRHPHLIEVKYRKDLAGQWPELKRKFRAARAYCAERQWRFFVLTETEIRTQRLKNIQWLWRYRFADTYLHHEEALINAMNHLDESTPQKLLECCYDAKRHRTEAMWALWVLIAQRVVEIDLDYPILMSSPIWLARIQERKPYVD